MSEEGRYIYGIIMAREKKSFGINGIDAGGEVYTISYQDIACVVSNSFPQDYNSMLKETLGRFLVKHQTIIEKIIKEHIIIPMKFGTNVSDDEEVAAILKSGYSRFKEFLARMEGKTEFDVVAIWNDLNSSIKEIGEQDEQIREFKAEIVKKPPNSALQDKIKIGMMLKDALDKRREKEQMHIIDYLKDVTVDFQKHQGMDDKMILNCAFLLEKSKEHTFDAALKELDKEYKQKVNFRCVGPLPPYSFVTCQFKKVEYSRLDKARKLLGLGDKVSLEEIKESYYNFAQRKHPDKYHLEMTNNKLSARGAQGSAFSGRIESKQLEDEFEKTTKAYKLLTSCCQGEDDKQKICLAAGRDFIAVEIIRP